jgi:protein-L-isoaspartate(D-aspartate) O-methyltransferase
VAPLTDDSGSSIGGAGSLDDEAGLRSQLVDLLIARGRIRTPAVERAMRSVSRHAFLPGLGLRGTYEDEAVPIKWQRGRALSSVSQPSMIASMLEMLEVQLGSRVLEIGTGSGYNAALLATLAGEVGRVVTVEIDEQLAETARSQLASAGFGRVEVQVGDGRAGWPSLAPYDRIIVSASSPGPEQSWMDQLEAGGRMVVPIARDLEAVAFAKVQGKLERRGSCPALFIPLR